MAPPKKPLTDPTLIQWTKTITKETTRRQYGMNLQRLLDRANVTGAELVAKVKKELRENDTTTYHSMMEYAKEFTTTDDNGKDHGHTTFMMLIALRRFLYDKGIYLPKIKVETPARVKPRPSLSWTEALKVCDAASKPYNVIFKLMLYCGWGIHEFLTFNTKATWKEIKNTKPTEPYYRFDFTGRKRNKSEFYSLIPMNLLREILASGIEVPLRTAQSKGKGNVPLDLTHYRIVETYMQSAFRTAIKRAAIPQKKNQPTPHTLRSTFRTNASIVGCDIQVAEFAMGHNLDKFGYDRLYNDEAFMWSNLSKYYGPVSASREEVEAKGREIAELKKIIGEPLQQEQLEIQEKIQQLLKQYGLPTTTPTDKYPPDLKQLQTELNRIQEKLIRLGLVKAEEIYG
jgi:integrase